MIDLLGIKPHQISTDIRGYKILMYALPGLGKTSEAIKPEGSLLFAVEKGYLAISGVNAVDIVTWADILTAVAQLKKPEVKERFKHVVIDTIDELVYIAEKHVCQTHQVNQLNEIPWGHIGSLI